MRTAIAGMLSRAMTTRRTSGFMFMATIGSGVMPMPPDIGGASTRDAATGAAAFGSVSNGEMRLLRLETEQPSFRGSKAASPRLFLFCDPRSEEYSPMTANDEGL